MWVRIRFSQLPVKNVAEKQIKSYSPSCSLLRVAIDVITFEYTFVVSAVSAGTFLRGHNMCFKTKILIRLYEATPSDSHLQGALKTTHVNTL